MDTKPHCVINPRTNRAVKTTSILGKKLLKDLENGNKSVVEAQKPVAKKSVAKTEVKNPVAKKSVAKTEVKKTIIQPKPPDSIFKRMTKFSNEFNSKSLYKKGFDAGLFDDNFNVYKTRDFYKPIDAKYENEKNELKTILKPWRKYIGWKQDDPKLKWSKMEQDIFLIWDLKPKSRGDSFADHMISIYRREKDRLKRIEANKPKRTDANKPEWIEHLPNPFATEERIVDEWDTISVGILFFQLSQKIESFKSIMKKTNDLTKRKNTVVPSDLFSFNPNLLNALVDKYGATKKGIDIIDEGMRYIVKYINEDAKFPDYIDYKYYTKHMSGSNKNKFSFLTTDKLKK